MSASGWFTEVIIVRIDKKSGDRKVTMWWWETIKEAVVREDPLHLYDALDGIRWREGDILALVEYGAVAKVERRLLVSQQEWSEAYWQCPNRATGIDDLVRHKVLESMGYSKNMADVPDALLDDWLYFAGQFADRVRVKLRRRRRMRMFDPRGCPTQEQPHE